MENKSSFKTKVNSGPLIISVLFIYCIFAALIITKENIMSTNSDFGRKGAMFGKVVLTIILFIILLIWIYNKNGHFVPVQ